MEARIRKELTTFVKNYPASRSLCTAWDEPLTAFADTADPLFEKLKEVVSPTHALPADLLETAQTVIAYFLPFDKRIPKSNKSGRNASEAWAMAYIETNRLIVNINTHLAAVLEGMGFESVVLPPTHNFDTDKLISDWSHKHVAYIAGLGNFGEHHLLITDKGCCGRLGSIITSAKIPPSQRSEAAYCLEKYGKSCGVCVEKCPTGALRPDGFDRHACYDLLLENADIFEEKGLADVCGKCSCIVPCSFKNPVAKLAANETKAE